MTAKSFNEIVLMFVQLFENPQTTVDDLNKFISDNQLNAEQKAQLFANPALFGGVSAVVKAIESGRWDLARCFIKEKVDHNELPKEEASLNLLRESLSALTSSGKTLAEHLQQLTIDVNKTPNYSKSIVAEEELKKLVEEAKEASIAKKDFIKKVADRLIQAIKNKSSIEFVNIGSKVFNNLPDDKIGDLIMYEIYKGFNGQTIAAADFAKFPILGHEDNFRKEFIEPFKKGKLFACQYLDKKLAEQIARGSTASSEAQCYQKRLLGLKFFTSRDMQGFINRSQTKKSAAPTASAKLLIQAVKNSDIAGVMQNLPCDSEVIIDGRFALDIALEKGDLAIAWCLIMNSQGKEKFQKFLDFFQAFSNNSDQHKEVKGILELYKGSAILSQPWFLGQKTALQIAYERGWHEIVDLLVPYGADWSIPYPEINESQESNSSEKSAAKDESQKPVAQSVEAYLKTYAPEKKKTTEQEFVFTISSMTKYKIDDLVKSSDWNKIWDSIRCAARLGDAEFISSLIMRLPSFAAVTDPDGLSILDMIELFYRGTQENKEQLKKYLRINGCVLNQELWDSYNALSTRYIDYSQLHMAILNGYADKVRELVLVNKSAIWSRDQQGNTLLHYAVKANKNLQEILALVLELDAFCNHKNKDGDTPLHFLARELIRLQNAKNDPHAETRKAIVAEAYNFLLENGADITIKNNNGETVKKIISENNPLAKSRSQKAKGKEHDVNTPEAYNLKSMGTHTHFQRITSVDPEGAKDAEKIFGGLLTKADPNSAQPQPLVPVFAAGAFGKAMPAVKLGKGSVRNVVLKSLQHQDKDTYLTLQREKKHTKDAQGHPNVVRYEGAIVKDKQITHFAVGVGSQGTLARLAPADRPENSESFFEGLALNRRIELMFTLLYQLLGALAHIHNNGLAHLDLKGPNIFLSEEGAMIGDFGSSLEFDDTKNAAVSDRSTKGPARFSAECMNNKEFDRMRDDLFALGICLLRVFTGMNIDAHTGIKEIAGIDPKTITENIIKHFEEQIAPAIKKLGDLLTEEILNDGTLNESSLKEIRDFLVDFVNKLLNLRGKYSSNTQKLYDDLFDFLKKDIGKFVLKTTSENRFLFAEFYKDLTEYEQSIADQKNSKSSESLRDGGYGDSDSEENTASEKNPAEVAKADSSSSSEEPSSDDEQKGVFESRGVRSNAEKANTSSSEESSSDDEQKIAPGKRYSNSEVLTQPAQPSNFGTPLNFFGQSPAEGRDGKSSDAYTRFVKPSSAQQPDGNAPSSRYSDFGGSKKPEQPRRPGI